MKRTRPILWLLIACALLTLWWLTGIQYPIVSDTANYALLGENVWTGQGYSLFGEPYAKHLPLHAIASYPLVAIFGYSLGMKLSSLLGGLGVLLMSFLLARRRFSVIVAIGTVYALVLHHGFIWMTIVGSADLLFATLVLGGLYAVDRAAQQTAWYWHAGALFGLACLTRYNAVPLVAILWVYLYWARPAHRRMGAYYGGAVLAALLFSTWLGRNWLVLGDPLYTEYTGELQTASPGLLQQLGANLLFYLNPLHNVLPIFLVLALYGMWQQRQKQVFLLVSILGICCLSAIWWVQGMRFVFPAYPILLMFAVMTLLHLWQRSQVVTGMLLVGILATHLSAICLYSIGQCNNWFDQTVGRIPADLGITSEGFYAFSEARDFINQSVETGATILVSDETKPLVWQGVFRADITMSAQRDICDYYRITREPWADEEVIYTTAAAPQTSVVLYQCQ